MATFDPPPNFKLKINGVRYRVSPEPRDVDKTWRVIGNDSIVYHLQTETGLFGGQSAAVALKVLKYQYRNLDTLHAVRQIAQLADGRATTACQMECITRNVDIDLIHTFAELDFCLLRPWIEGTTWADLLTKGRGYDFSQQSSYALANHLVRTLARWESRQVAHCDLSSANLLITSDSSLALLDVDGVFMPGLPLRSAKGSPGYTFPRLERDELWGPLGDRFAGAILIAEIIGWCDPRIRQACYGASFFEQAELQNQFSPRYNMVNEKFASINPNLARLFARAWQARSLAECPPLGEWAQLLGQLS